MTLDDLERIAREATQPSPWTTHESDNGEVTVVDAHGMWVAEVGFAPQDARHIATFSPATVLALLAELRSARAAVEAAEALAAAMEHDVAIVEQYRAARERGGQHVGTGGQLGALPPSGLAAIRRYARDLRSAIDRHRTRKP